MDGRHAYVGTDIEYAKYQEFGTSTTPARPFMGGALIAKGAEIKEIFGFGALKAIGPR
jgi:HK97 gp10 family phage protein